MEAIARLPDSSPVGLTAETSLQDLDANARSELCGPTTIRDSHADGGVVRTSLLGVKALALNNNSNLINSYS